MIVGMIPKARATAEMVTGLVATSTGWGHPGTAPAAGRGRRQRGGPQ